MGPLRARVLLLGYPWGFFSEQLAGFSFSRESIISTILIAPVMCRHARVSIPIASPSNQSRMALLVSRTQIENYEFRTFDVCTLVGV